MKLKKICSIVLCIIVLSMFSVPSFAIVEDVGNDNYNILLEKGLSESFLNNKTDDYLQKMVDMIGDDDIGNVETSVGRMSDLGVSTLGSSIPTDQMTFQITTLEIYKSNSDQLGSVLVGVSWEWAKNKPLYTGQDAVSVDWDNTVFTYSSEFFAQDLYKDNASADWTVFKEYSTPAKAAQGGIGHWTNLKSFEKYVGGAMLFVLLPASQMFKGSTKSTVIDANYVHAKSPITNLSISIIGFGIGIGINPEILSSYVSASRTLEYSK